jgi:predicted transcriptional regulator
LDYVPQRYRKTKLSPDWYFGPGKKKSGKRKHRKQRGKIGFVELSQIVAARWAKLEETDPDIKSFIQKLANQELEEYRRDMKEYKKLIKNMTSTPATTKNKSKKRVLEGRFKYEDGASQMLSESYPSSSFLSNNDDLGVKDFQYNPVTKIHGRNVE